MQYSISWTRPASPSDPVSLNGTDLGPITVTSGYSYSGTVSLGSGGHTLEISRGPVAGDSVSLSVTNTGLTAHMINASALGINTLLAAMTLQLGGIQGYYVYHVMNGTTSVNKEYVTPVTSTSFSVSSNVDSSVSPPPNAISLIEVASNQTYFSTVSATPPSYTTYGLNVTRDGSGNCNITYLDTNGWPYEYNVSGAPNSVSDYVGCGYAIYQVGGSTIYSFNNNPCGSSDIAATDFVLNHNDYFAGSYFNINLGNGYLEGVNVDVQFTLQSNSSQLTSYEMDWNGSVIVPLTTFAATNLVGYSGNPLYLQTNGTDSGTLTIKGNGTIVISAQITYSQ